MAAGAMLPSLVPSSHFETPDASRQIYPAVRHSTAISCSRSEEDCALFRLLRQAYSCDSYRLSSRAAVPHRDSRQASELRCQIQAYVIYVFLLV